MCPAWSLRRMFNTSTDLSMCVLRRYSSYVRTTPLTIVAASCGLGDSMETMIRSPTLVGTADTTAFKYPTGFSIPRSTLASETPGELSASVSRVVDVIT